jgi:hypothetical protein
LYEVLGMNGCEEIRELLVAVARRETVSASAERFLREHLEICAQCRRRLVNEQMVTRGLTSISSAGMPTPPPAVKAALLAAFRKQQVVVPIRRQLVKWVAIAAVAAALVVVVLVSREPGPAKVVVPVVTAPAPVIAPVLTAENKPPVQAKAHPTSRRRVVKAPPKAVEEPAEVATDFFEIPYVEPLRPEQRADVFRMQMPRASMAAFGLPVTGGRLDSRVTADVLMGEDGVARAIRFIR